MKRVFFEAKKVQLNESFKKLYGFNKKAYKDSYCAQLENIITMFPGFTSEFDELLLNLELIWKDSWWKDERDAEVHIDAAKLYELRHEEINESKVVMEAVRLTDLFNRFNHYTAEMHRTRLNHMIAGYVKEKGICTPVSWEWIPAIHVGFFPPIAPDRACHVGVKVIPHYRNELNFNG